MTGRRYRLKLFVIAVTLAFVWSSLIHRFAFYVNETTCEDSSAGKVLAIRRVHSGGLLSTACASYKTAFYNKARWKQLQLL